ncbi:hypothetical protein IWQ61_003636 [Dispira simplex]|nr:hypothetical protein IWQ61_003636 [Dispira simplex]
MPEDSGPTPLSRTQLSCLQLLHNARTDEEKFTGLLLIPRVFDSQNESHMVALLTHLDMTFIQRLFHSTDHPDADSYCEVGLAVVASFCVHWNLLNQPVLLSLLPHLIHTLKESVDRPDVSLVKDIVPILVQLATHPEGLTRLRDEGDTLVPTLIKLIHIATIDEALCSLAVRIVGRLLGCSPRCHLGDQQDPNSTALVLRYRVWITTLRGGAQLLYSEQRQLKFEILGAISDALSGIQTNEDVWNLVDLYFTKPDEQSPLQSSSHTGYQILHSLLLIKLTLVSILRHSHGPSEQKDVALLLTAQLVRLFGHAFFVPAGSSQFPRLRKELLALDHSVDPSINLGDVLTAVQETEEAKCFSLWLRMASIEFRMLLDERMLVPPEQSLAEIPAKRQEWMLPASLTILEAAIRYLAWVDDAPHITELTSEQSNSNLGLVGPIDLSPTYLEQVAHAHMTSLDKGEVLTWLNCLKESFSAAVVYLEELQMRGALTKALNDTVTLAVVRGLCCWLTQDLTLLIDYPQLPHLLQTIIVSETQLESTGHFIRPVVQLWLDSMVADDGPYSKIFTSSVCDLVQSMGQTLALLP